MAIAVLPDEPRGRWERIGFVLLTIAATVVVALLLAFLLLEYVF